MSISSKVNACIESASWIRKMFEEGAALREQHGADQVFDFSLGNPTVEPPPEFLDALKQLETMVAVLALVIVGRHSDG